MTVTSHPSPESADSYVSRRAFRPKQDFTGWGAPKSIPAGLTPVKPFSADMVPCAVGAWIEDIAERMQCPPDYVAVSAMVGLGTALGRRVSVKPQTQTDWVEVSNLWGCVVGRPGAMKSPAMAEALKPLNRLEKNARVANEEQLRQHKRALAMHKLKVEASQAQVKQALKKGENASLVDIEEPEAPKARRFITNDSTYESLGEILVDNPNGVLVFRDELVTLLKTLDREEYSAARGFYLSGWNGTGGYSFDRIVRGHSHLDAVCISLLGSTQPGKLSEYLARASSGSSNDDGMVQRFGLLVWPDDNGTWREVDRYPETEAREAAWTAFERLERLEPMAIGAEVDQFDSIPSLRLSPGAREVFAPWHAKLERSLREGALHASLESHFSKYRKLVPALSLINHLADGGEGPVSAAAVSRALAYTDYLESHARRAYGSGLHREASAAQAILNRIRKGELDANFSPRDVLRHGWSNLNDKVQIASGLDLLEDLEWVRGEAQPAGPAGGRPKVTYKINPRAIQ